MTSMSSPTPTASFDPDRVAAQFPADEVRDDFVPKEAYFSADFARLEAARLWPRVWQIACRVEELPTVGSYVTYDIVDDSIVVVRTSASEIKAYHNVCTHRGRRLVDGCGSARRFQCPFHGWQFELDGRPAVVVDRDDWGDGLKDDDIVVGHLMGGRKVTNVARDPRVVLTVEAEGANPVGMSNYLIVQGTARLVEGGAPELLQRLAETYVGPGVRFPPMDDPPPGHVIHITAERIGGVGPWTA